MNNAIFLDRDGTINEDIGDLYAPEKLVFIPGAVDALKVLQKDFMLFIITNQSGIGKGVFDNDEYIRFNDYFINTLAEHGVGIKEVFCCPHIKEEKCICRKPGTYFIEEAGRAYDLDIGNSYCIGDHPHDMEMAERSGAHSVYLLTGHGIKHRGELNFQPDYIADDLYEAALWIMDKTTQ